MAIATSSLIAVAVAAAATAASTALTMSAQANQADAQKQAAQQQADAERAAGEARRRQVEYDAEQHRKSFLSREAAAGVQVGQGSLLESEVQFAHDAAYSAQLAEYPHLLAGSNYDYQSRLFGYQAGRIRSTLPIATAMSAGTSLATSYGSIGRSLFSSGGPSSTDVAV